MTFDEYKKEWVGKRVRETVALGYQCVAQAKQYAKLVDGHFLKSFGGAEKGSALNGRETGSPFVGLPYARCFYNGKGYPPRGSIIFFDKTEKNTKGHIAIAGQCNKDEVRVIEQNAVTGNGKGLGGDAISIRNYPYKGGKTGNVLGRFTCYRQF